MIPLQIWKGIEKYCRNQFQIVQKQSEKGVHSIFGIITDNILISFQQGVAKITHIIVLKNIYIFFSNGSLLILIILTEARRNTDLFVGLPILEKNYNKMCKYTQS